MRERGESGMLDTTAIIHIGATLENEAGMTQEPEQTRKALYEQVEVAKAENRGKKRVWPKVANNKRLRNKEPW